MATPENDHIYEDVAKVEEKPAGQLFDELVESKKQQLEERKAKLGLDFTKISEKRREFEARRQARLGKEDFAVVEHVQMKTFH